MRIAIIGLGGIGGYFGTKLLLRYEKDREHEIIFIQRGIHLEKIRTSGLRYLTKNNDHLVHPSIVTDDPSRAGLFDLVVLCIKNYDLEKALEAVSGNLKPGTVVLTVLNGMDIAERARNILPRTTVLPGCIYLSATMDRPGVVRQTGGVGNFFFGPETGPVEEFRWLEKLLSDSGIKAVLSGDINVRLWEKYIFVSSFATITTLYDRSIGQIINDPSTFKQAVCLMEEIRLLAARQGTTLDESIIDSSLKRAALIPPETRTSFQIDFTFGKRVEFDTFTGYVYQKGRELGIPFPCHEEMYHRLKEMLDKRKSI